MGRKTKQAEENFVEWNDKPSVILDAITKICIGKKSGDMLFPSMVVKFSDGKIDVYSYHNSSALIVYGTYENENIEGEGMYYIRFDDLYDAIKNVFGSKEKVHVVFKEQSVLVEDENDEVNIPMEQMDETKNFFDKGKAKFIFMEQYNSIMPLGKDSGTYLTTSVEINADEFKKLKSRGNLTGAMEINMKMFNNEIVCAMGEIGTKESYWSKTKIIGENGSGPEATAKYSFEYMTNISNVLCDKIRVFLGGDAPIWIDNGNVFYLLAPTIEEDE